MKRTKNTVPTEFAAETRFAVRPVPAAPFTRTIETELDRLKNRLLREWLAIAPAPDFYAPLRRASNEAAALAWDTAFPLLVLPELFREKAESAGRYTRKQVALLKPTTPGMGQAA
jgi:hypothetical protein